MPEMQMIEERVPEPNLFITIGNEYPIDAEELGRLVRELGTDYRRATGGRLILTRLELGSTHIWLQDAAIITLSMATGALTLSDAGERMAKYWGHLKNYLKGSSEVKTDPELLPVASAGSRLLDIAERHRASLEITRDLKNNTETIKMTFPEVSSANARAKERKKKKRQKRLLGSDEQTRIGEYARQLSDSAPAGSGYSEMEGVVEAIVGIIKTSGGEYLLVQIAQALEGLNRWDLAKVVRRHIDDGKSRLLLRRD